VFFDVRVAARGKGLAAFLVNGRAEVPCASAAWDGTTLTLGLPAGGTIAATRKGEELDGRYTRAGASASVAFTAGRAAPRLPAGTAGRSLAGAWTFALGGATFSGVLAQSGAALDAVLSGESGDLGSPHGWFDGEQFVLTLFDGERMYRLDGELLPDGTLAGEYRARTDPPVSFRARRSDATPAR
jgi:hypothetical protein